MDKVKGRLFPRVDPPFGSVLESCVGTDKDVSQIRIVDRECDAVGGGRVVKKLGVEAANARGGHKMDADLLARDRFKEDQGPDHPPHSSGRKGEVLLPVGDMDHKIRSARRRGGGILLTSLRAAWAARETLLQALAVGAGWHKKDLSDGGLRKARDFLMLPIFPAAEFTEDVDPLKPLENVPLLSRFATFSVASMSCHISLPWE